MKERNESLDCLKGIAILLVMFGHVQVHNHMTDPYLYDVIKSIQMPMFFLISGYLAGTGKKITNLEQYRKKIGRRAVAYLLLFLAGGAAYDICAPGITYSPVSAGLWIMVSDGIIFIYRTVLYGTAS